MYTVMKSEQTALGITTKGASTYAQKKVAQYPLFDEALAACEKANRESQSRHYLMNESGQEYYALVWID
jgi:hypothetical protein